ncbi:hypothetical protein CABS01_02241 [Colletotrichum abscissum]|uniref:uncharacterized protein n=1 Tax=Colletotrichum abscissum TaxID=1671311 RepID=UPI0027D52D98|nr:uncharacterized protein CABS01_02241 [Colletotrichum abscissum]KAK1488611.1 hypothetical protein CABS01_02241 [Colletotrichum abscissum]
MDLAWPGLVYLCLPLFGLRRSIYLQPKHNRVVKTGGTSPSIDTCIERALTQLLTSSQLSDYNKSPRPSSFQFIPSSLTSSSRPPCFHLFCWLSTILAVVAVSCFASLFVLLHKIPLNNHPYLLASTTVIPPHHRHPLSVPLGRTGVNRVELCSPVIEAPPCSLPPRQRRQAAAPLPELPLGS